MDDYSEGMNDKVVEKLALFKTIHIHHPRMQRAHGLLDFMRRSGLANRGRPQKALRMLGPSGSGKSTAVESFVATLSPVPGTRPVLHVSLQHAATPRRLWADMLTAFEDEFAPIGKEEVLKARARKFIEREGVEVIVIDEVQQLVPKEGARTAWNVAEALKRLLDEGLASVVLMGTFEARPLFRANPQLNNRLQAIFDLDPLDATLPDHRDLFIGYCGRLDQRMEELGVVSGRAGLMRPEILACLYCVSSGIVGVVSNLVVAALEISIRRSATVLTVDDLSLATDRWAIPAGHCEINPFIAGPTARFDKG